ncbi:MAG TPA: type II toxin-antitoxin system VapC family toxin [Thermoanaerobaculia bacterium]|nr:type II toxin-antitoxin system VapC family toxin [Thermoanaerobaculia bacterium]
MARPRGETGLSARRLVLDSGAVIALSRGETRARAFVARARELSVPVEIPVVAVAETIRGGPRDAPVHRVLKAVGTVPPAGERHGRTAGRLLGAARSTSTVDALVVAQAIEGGGAVVLTGDPDDLRRLAVDHPEVRVERL